MKVLKKTKQKKRKQPVKKTLPAVPNARPQQWTPPFPGVGKRKTGKIIDDTNPIPEPPQLVETAPTYNLPTPPKIDENILREANRVARSEKKTIYPREQKARKEFLRVFKSLTYRWRSWDIWTDFVTLTACSISNAVDKVHFDEREKTYLRIIRKYNEEEQQLFPKLFAHTVMALEENPEQDFLGELYTELGLNSKEHEQVFTPYNVAHMMAEITMGDIEKQVEDHGYVEIHDCCCGGGVTLIAAANVAKNKLAKSNLNFQNHVLVTGQDIDYIVTMMCYIQLSLLGLAGYFKIGNALTEPMASEDSLDNYWFTPMYFFPVWYYRRVWRNLSKLFESNADEEKPRFELGQVVMTAEIDERMKADKKFDRFVNLSFNRFTEGDWGDLCDEDKELCDKAVKNGGQMIMGEYEQDDETIWIITEWDRSATTIMFPHER